MKTLYDAPWSNCLKWVSLLSSLLLLAVSGLIPVPGIFAQFWWPIRLFGPVLLIGTSLFTVRNYEIRDRALWVQRLLWKTRIPLDSLSAVEFRPGPFGWAWRTCGNGGLFSFSGWYYQKPLGSFRALATRLNDAVILKFNDRHPIVITPEEPELFVQHLRKEPPNQI